MNQRWLAMFGIAALYVSGCRDTPLGPSEVVSDGLRVVAQALPYGVSAGDSVRVGAMFYNDSDQSITVGFGMGCPFYLEVVRRSSGDRVPMDGTGYPCLAIGSSLTIPARDSLGHYRWVSTSDDGTPSERGRYRAQLDFSNGLWDLEAEFRVR